MRSIAEIHELLDRLNEVVADELEDQDLDFKEWKGSVDHMVKLVVEMAVCMANGGGGTVVFGVADTRYSDRKDGSEALPLALREMEQRIHLDNPIRTLELGLIHPEVRAYPQIALREALMNAFCHADYRLPGPILVKQFPGKIEISNPGGFIGGITERNILHHPPVPRNPALVEALAKLRLVNRSNLGIGRMFEAMLIEGKEPPQIVESGDSVTVHFLRQDVVPEFRKFVAEESQRGHHLGLDELLVIQYLLRHAELETIQAAALCQRSEAQMRNTLSQMERDRAYIERGGTGRGAYWVLSAKLAQRLRPGSRDEAQRRIDWEGAKTRVLSILKQRAERGEGGITNKEIRAITHYDRNQVIRLMRELHSEAPQINRHGHGAGSRYTWKGKPDER